MLPNSRITEYSLLDLQLYSLEFCFLDKGEKLGAAGCINGDVEEWMSHQSPVLWPDFNFNQWGILRKTTITESRLEEAALISKSTLLSALHQCIFIAFCLRGQASNYPPRALPGTGFRFDWRHETKGLLGCTPGHFPLVYSLNGYSLWHD